MKKLLALLLCFGTLLHADTKSQESVVMSEPDLSTFKSLVFEAKLQDFFQGTGPFTSFVPSNSAFSKFDQKKLESLREEKHRDELIDFINYHIILGKYLSQNLKPGTVRTLSGKNITIRIEGDQVWVNDAKVTRKNLEGPNGVTHIIDGVLAP
ncbi:MAG: fasciclin domain-containing protein [Verrucomicrobia bacterium]|nr:fasciclin domain-containing protein [Verrucomicrobiota bacterium]MBS0637613.1 fasciclin domain-containing protein [Verrucomicrobiota bacterium]